MAAEDVHFLNSDDDSGSGLEALGGTRAPARGPVSKPTRGMVAIAIALAIGGVMLVTGSARPISSTSWPKRWPWQAPQSSLYQSSEYEKHCQDPENFVGDTKCTEQQLMTDDFLIQRAPCDTLGKPYKRAGVDGKGGSGSPSIKSMLQLCMVSEHCRAMNIKRGYYHPEFELYGEHMTRMPTHFQSHWGSPAADGPDAKFCTTSRKTEVKPPCEIHIDGAAAGIHQYQVACGEMDAAQQKTCEAGGNGVKDIGAENVACCSPSGGGPMCCAYASTGELLKGDYNGRAVGGAECSQHVHSLTDSSDSP